MLNQKLYLVIAILAILATVGVACAQPASIPAPDGTPQPAPAPAPDGTPQPAPAPAANGILQVYVTDAPPRNEVTSIMLTVEEVQIHKALAEQEMEQEQSNSDNQTQEQEEQQTQQGEGEWITIEISNNATTFDLLQVKGIEQFLGTSELAEGKYTQVRLVVGKIQVALDNGELQDATVPSQELKLVHPFDVVAGEITAMIIDFDADKMVRITGAEITVRPVVKLITRQEKPDKADKADKETAGETSVEVSCDDFMSVNQVSKELEVNAGDTFEVILCSNPTTGFQWSESAAIGDTAVVEQTSHSFVPPEAKGNNPAAPGTPGQEIWTFEALKEGTTTISMEYSRPWEDESEVEWTFTLTVDVK